MAGRPMARWSAALFIVAGCLVDKDEVCGANQVKHNTEYEGCVCVPGTVPNDDGAGCRTCGRNQEAKAGRCVAIVSDSGTADADGGSDSGTSTGMRGEGESCGGPDDCASYYATAG